jgi:hypothetical protein
VWQFFSVGLAEADRGGVIGRAGRLGVASVSAHRFLRTVIAFMPHWYRVRINPAT